MTSNNESLRVECTVLYWNKRPYLYHVIFFRVPETQSGDGADSYGCKAREGSHYRTVCSLLRSAPASHDNARAPTTGTCASFSIDEERVRHLTDAIEFRVGRWRCVALLRTEPYTLPEPAQLPPRVDGVSALSGRHGTLPVARQGSQKAADTQARLVRDAPCADGRPRRTGGRGAGSMLPCAPLRMQFGEEGWRRSRSESATVETSHASTREQPSQSSRSSQSSHRADRAVQSASTLARCTPQSASMSPASCAALGRASTCSRPTEGSAGRRCWTRPGVRHLAASARARLAHGAATRSWCLPGGRTRSLGCSVARAQRCYESGGDGAHGETLVVPRAWTNAQRRRSNHTRKGRRQPPVPGMRRKRRRSANRRGCVIEVESLVSIRKQIASSKPARCVKLPKRNARHSLHAAPDDRRIISHWQSRE